MDIDKILKSDLINKAELARRLWPGNKDAPGYLNRKMSNKNNRSLTLKDISAIEGIIKKELL